MIALEKKSQNTRMPRNTLRTYAEIIKSTTTSKDSEIEIQRRKQRESLLQERAKYRITLTTKDMNTATRQLIINMSAKEIVERCQQAMNDTSTFNFANQRIQ